MKGRNSWFLIVVASILVLTIPVFTQPASAVAPEEVDEADPWKDVRECDITAVMVKVGEGKVSPNYTNPNEIYEGAGTYEYWVLAILDGSDDGLRYVPTTDRWGNPLLGKIWVKNLDQVAEGEVEVYNGNGHFARGYNTPGSHVDVDEPLLCLEPKIEKIEWTPAEELLGIRTYQIQFGSDGYNFRSKFLGGKMLSEEELRLLVVETRHGNGSFWVGTGFIGGGTSSGGFGLTADGELLWSWFRGMRPFYLYPDSPSESSLGSSFLLGREIVVRTEIFGWGGVELPEPSIEYQRFVLWEDCGGMLRMLEPVWK